jgi:hypothetical protein
LVIPKHPAFSTFVHPCPSTSRATRNNKRGFIAAGNPSILQRLNIDPKQWLFTCTRIEEDYYLAIGSVAKLEAFAERLEQRSLKGINACR